MKNEEFELYQQLNNELNDFLSSRINLIRETLERDQETLVEYATSVEETDNLIDRLDKDARNALRSVPTYEEYLQNNNDAEPMTPEQYKAYVDEKKEALRNNIEDTENVEQAIRDEFINNSTEKLTSYYHEKSAIFDSINEEVKKYVQDHIELLNAKAELITANVKSLDVEMKYYKDLLDNEQTTSEERKYISKRMREIEKQKKFYNELEFRFGAMYDIFENIEKGLAFDDDKIEETITNVETKLDGLRKDLDALNALKASFDNHIEIKITKIDENTVNIKLKAGNEQTRDGKTIKVSDLTDTNINELVRQFAKCVKNTAFIDLVSSDVDILIDGKKLEPVSFDLVGETVANTFANNNTNEMTEQKEETVEEVDEELATTEEIDTPSVEEEPEIIIPDSLNDYLNKKNEEDNTEELDNTEDVDNVEEINETPTFDNLSEELSSIPNKEELKEEKPVLEKDSIQYRIIDSRRAEIFKDRVNISVLAVCAAAGLSLGTVSIAPLFVLGAAAVGATVGLETVDNVWQKLKKEIRKKQFIKAGEKFGFKTVFEENGKVNWVKGENYPVVVTSENLATLLSDKPNVSVNDVNKELDNLYNKYLDKYSYRNLTRYPATVDNLENAFIEFAGYDKELNSQYKEMQKEEKETQERIRNQEELFPANIDEIINSVSDTMDEEIKKDNITEEQLEEEVDIPTFEAPNAESVDESDVIVPTEETVDEVPEEETKDDTLETNEPADMVEPADIVEPTEIAQETEVVEASNGVESVDEVKCVPNDVEYRADSYSTVDIADASNGVESVDEVKCVPSDVEHPAYSYSTDVVDASNEVEPVDIVSTPEVDATQEPSVDEMNEYDVMADLLNGNLEVDTFVPEGPKRGI